MNNMENSEFESIATKLSKMKQRKDLDKNVNRATVTCKTVFQLPNMHISEP